MVGLLTSLIGSVGALGTGTLTYSLFEAQAFTCREFSIDVLPPGSSDIRLLHLSDLHLTPSQSRKIKWLQSLVKFEPDLVVGTGDFLSHRFGVAAVAEALSPLMHTPGMFVLGSNDYFAPFFKNPVRYLAGTRKVANTGQELPTDDLINLFLDNDWIDLNNKQDLININGVKIHARGTNDPHIKLDDYSKVSGAYTDDAFSLGVTHAPYVRVLEQFSQDETDFMIAGHTHGGQVCVPFYGALVTNCDLPTKQAKGLSTFTHDGYEMPLHVSAGIGTSPYTPVRFACRPEASLITLRARSI